MIDNLDTPTCSVSGETGVFRIISTCMPGGIWSISITYMQMFSRKGISLITFFIDVYLTRVSCTIRAV